MSISPATIAEQDTRPDPNNAQRAAADPEASVWVAASAGSGKTKVLTDRVLRLLLPRTDGQPGTPPEKILCLTFTKAGASEMSLRINQTLALWATMPLLATSSKDGLTEVLAHLLGRTPGEADIHAARRLFARVVDAPGGIKILTIHAFCQSILGRFPLEAGLPPHFTVLSGDAAKEMIQQARDYVLKNAAREPESDLNLSLGKLAAALNEDQFADLMRALSSERQSLESLLKQNEGADPLYRRMCAHLGINPDISVTDLIRTGCADEALSVEMLRQATKILCDSKGVTDNKNGEIMADWLAADMARRVAAIDTYKGAFLTQKNEVKAAKNLASVASEKTMPGLLALMQEEGERLKKLQEKINTVACTDMTHHLLVVGQAIIRRYQDLKIAQAGLDFDDMINHTRALLTKASMSSWVLYKLDGGLDHILVDEAQDTNPEQWDIVESLIREFFSGQSGRDVRRTLFVVGDEKQSIFSFQRAAPDRFREKRAEFQRIVENAGETWKSVPMDISFRSTAAVLDFTDAVFAEDPVRYGVSDTPIRHFSFRAGHAGHIEQWPLFRTPKDDNQKNESWWTPNLTARTQNSAQTLLARHIAEQVKNWIDSGEALPSRGRAIRPDDIMILVRNRNALVGHLIRELKSRNIPVNGLDRMKLGDHIAIQDMMALARFALLPDDDLSLACVLKSPLANWDDQRLEDIALGRRGSLWQDVQEKAADIAPWLAHLIVQAKAVRPYEFFSHVLQSSCPASNISGLHAMTARLSSDAIDPLDEFLNQVLGFEGDHISTVQGFVLWQQQNETEIKREQEESGGRVRIMTVHASKGLQAPIVILPDTIKTAGSGGNRASDRLLWPAKTGLPFPFWSPHAGNDCPAYDKARDKVRNKDQEEYRRLLYVALTRAEDRLYIGAAAGKNSHDEGSWYELTKDAFVKFDNTDEIPFTASPAILEGLDHHDDLVTRILHRKQTADAVAKDAKHSGPELILPDLTSPGWRWCRNAPPQEPAIPRPLVPSQASMATQEESTAPSPLSSQNNYRFRRGNVTHRLLQFLPDISARLREDAAHSFTARYGHDLPEQIRREIVAETMDVLNKVEFAALFGHAARAEVPITGLIDGKLVSGQIDRLLVTDTEIHIIDYKTNRPPPQDEKDVPDIYRLQLRAYRDTLAKIYPERQVRTYLLWTDGPRLMEISL